MAERKNIVVFIQEEAISVDGDKQTAYKLSTYHQDKFIKEGTLQDSELIAYGFDIFSNIFSTDSRKERISKILRELKDDDRLTITINSQSPDLHNIPFEIINEDRTEEGFLLKRGNISIIRTIPGLDKKIIPAKPPIRVLVLLSLPLEVYEKHPIDPLRELNVIYTALDDHIRSGLVEIDIEEKANIPTVREKLLKGHYHIVHFIGHGEEGGFLLIEDEEDNERGKLLTSDGIRNLFSGANVSLFFFNACKTAKASPYLPSLAYHLFTGIDSSYIIANLAQVKDELATETTFSIYGRLLEEGGIENVLNVLRVRLTRDWWKPILFGEIKKIFDIEKVEERERTKKVIFRPPQTIKHYVYRYGIVRQASSLIDKKSHLLLHGIGGAGKSTLSAYLSEFFEAKFSHIIFIDLKNEGIKREGELVERIIEEFEIEGLLKKDELENLHIIKKWRELNQKIKNYWLLILDNLETIQDKDGIISPNFQRLITEILNTNTVFTILTSRLRTSLSKRQQIENTLEIGEYTQEEVGFLISGLDKNAQEFFLKNYRSIVESVGFHPLSLSKIIEKEDIALNKIFETDELKGGLEFYREYLEDKREEIEKLFLLKYPFSKNLLNSIFCPETISLLVERLLILKRLNGHYSPYPIIYSYFRDEFEPKDLTKIMNELLKIEEDLSPYDRMNILSILTDYHKMTKDKGIEDTLIRMFSSISRWDGLKEIDVSALLLKFEESLREIKEKNNAIAATYNSLAEIYHAKGDYDRAIEYYNKALKIYEDKSGRDHPNTATTYNNLAAVYHDKGDYKEAIEYYNKALKIYEDKLDRDHPNTATTYNNLAMVYHAKGDYDKAIEYYNKALKIYEDKSGRDHPNTAATYNNLAGVYRDKGDYDRAIEYYNKALKICEDRLGRDHPNTAATYNNLAGVYRDKGDYDKAIEYYNKALKVREKKLGRDHPDTAGTYNNLAGVYHDKGDYDKAIEYYNKALKIAEDKLGRDHPNTAATYNNLAVVYRAKGDYDKAIEYYNKALKIYEDKLGRDHPDTAQTYNNLAVVYHAKGDYDKAIEYYNKALKIREDKLGRDHPDTAQTYNNLAGIYHDKKDYDKAIEYFNKALKIAEDRLGRDHPNTATTYNNLAVVYHAKGDYDKAIGCFNQALNIYRNTKDYLRIFQTLPYLIDATLKSSLVDYLKLSEYICEFLEVYEIFRDKTDVSFRCISLFIRNNTFKDLDIERLKTMIREKPPIFSQRLDGFLNQINSLSSLLTEKIEI